MMRRPACIQLHRFEVELLEKRHPHLKEVPVAAYDDKGHIVSINPLARGAGIEEGCSVKEAATRLQNLALLPAPAGLEKELFQLGVTMLQYSPVVSTLRRRELFVDLAPSQHLFGGEHGLLKRLLEAFQQAGHSVRIAVADSIPLARLASYLSDRTVWCLPAGSEDSFLAKVPVQRMTRLPEFQNNTKGRRLLTYLGVDSLLDLKKESHRLSGTLRSAEWKELLMYISGNASWGERLHPVREPVRFEEQIPFFPSVVQVEPLLNQLGLALERLQQKLEGQRRLACRLELTLTREDRDEDHFQIVLAQPTRKAQALLRLFEVKFESLILRQPLADLCLAVTHTVPDASTGSLLFEPSKHTAKRVFPQLLNTLDSVLERRNVLFRWHRHEALLPEQRYRIQHPLTVAREGKGEVAAYSASLYGRLSISPSLPLPLFLQYPAFVFLRGEGGSGPSRVPTSPSFAFQFALYDARHHAVKSHRYIRFTTRDGRLVLARETDTPSVEILGVYD